jgi:hypothetical protein
MSLVEPPYDAALARAWDAEGKLAGIADTLNQELRENGGDRFQTTPQEDMRVAIRHLVDCVRRASTW